MSRPAGVALVLLTTLAPVNGNGQQLRVAMGGTVDQVKRSTARGYEAYPVVLLERLDATVLTTGDTVTVVLYGDTLSFRPGFP